MGMLGSLPSWLTDGLAAGWAIVLRLGEPALFFLLLAVILNHRNLASVFSRLLPPSLRINLLAYTFDAVLIIAPVSLCLVSMSTLLISHGWVLITPEWFVKVPDGVLLLVTLLVGDLISYWRHRFEHSRFLWPAHAFHHSDEHMTWLTLFRFHPINRFTSSIIDVGGLLLLGFPWWAILFNNVVRHYYGMFVHANVPWTFGVVGRVLVSPAMHRWHHVREGQGIYSNYATVFSIFDQAFGTYYVPGPCDVPLGVSDVKDQSFRAQLGYPFRYVYSRRARAKATLSEEQQLSK